MKTEKHNNSKSNEVEKRWIFLPIFIVVVMWVISWVLIVIYIKEWNQRGNFGDMFGAVNALFAGLAFAGIIITVYLQTKELALQRKELEYTRDEIKKQRMQLEKQNETLSVQKFENTFFNLLRLHHEIVNVLDLRRRMEVIAEGRDCFKTIYEEFYRIAIERGGSIDSVIYSYEEVFNKHQADLGHYFRNLYHIFKYVHFSGVPFPEKHRYANFARAQLSSYELLLLFYNCLSKNGQEKFKPLVEEYQILKNMPIEKLVHINHKENYEPTAFKKVDT